ncbi:MAG: hypothetical protein MUF18_17985 [Fimbriiglobus sp.]|jgi:hypothetical protein|nr:hypothetical protein [Fimbriiglobus sp.]
MARLRLALTLAAIVSIAVGDRALAQAAAPAPQTPPDPSAVLLSPVVSGPVNNTTSADDTPLPPREPSARIALNRGEFTAVRQSEYEQSRRESLARPQADDPDDGLAYLTRGRYRRGADGLASRSQWEDTSTRQSEGWLAGLWSKWFGRGDDGRTPGERFGDRVGEMVNGGRDPIRERKWFESDHAFCDFVSPLSNPFFFEDPRTLSEVRGVGFYQQTPAGDRFNSGNAWFLGGQGRLAFTERFSVVVHKLGFAAFNPGGGSIFRGGSGLSELWLGPKYVAYRDPEFKSLITLGAQFQIPLGSSSPLQDTGSLSIVPYVSAGQKLLSTQIGTFNGMASAGYSFSTNRDRSDFFYASAHLDFDIGNGHRFYPVAELNWFSYTTDGRERPVGVEGRDFANVGGAARGTNLVTWTLGLRWRSLNGRWEVGGGYEGFLFGQRGLFNGRVMLDLIWRF